MRATYRFLAYAISVLVVVQAGAIAYAVSGLGAWVQDGGVLDAATLEDESVTFPGLVGFIVHGMNGTMLIPAVSLVLLIVSFFARIPAGLRWALLVLLLVGVQVTLGTMARSAAVPELGLLHGVNALLLFTAALYAGRRVAKATRVSAAPSVSEHVTI
jgi:heme A synthase